MKKLVLLLFILVLAWGLIVVAIFGTGKKNKASAVFAESRIDGYTPLYFSPYRKNRKRDVKYYARASKYILYLTADGLTFEMIPGDAFRKKSPAVSRLVFLGRRQRPEIVPVNIENVPVQKNGNSADIKMVTAGKAFLKWEAVKYRDIYTNIDLKLYGNETNIQYDWIVKPGGNPESICFKYLNVKETRIDGHGNLVIVTPVGRLLHTRPVCYQLKKGREVPVAAEFKKITTNIYGFRIAAYDRSILLIIDPIVKPDFFPIRGRSEYVGN
jgi:hypothetical protein